VRRIAWWAPGLAVIIHRGRRTGREYCTPVLLLTRPAGYVIALPYGTRADRVATSKRPAAPRPPPRPARLPRSARRVFSIVGVHRYFELSPIR
jgi:hypothetical protein